jgi:hypothetical protein
MLVDVGENENKLKGLLESFQESVNFEACGKLWDKRLLVKFRFC